MLETYGGSLAELPASDAIHMELERTHIQGEVTRRPMPPPAQAPLNDTAKPDVADIMAQLDDVVERAREARANSVTT